MTSAGDTASVDKAKNILLYAVVGIVLILLSFAIVNTVLGAATSGGSSSRCRYCDFNLIRILKSLASAGLFCI